MGHAVRCLALAQALTARGARIGFVSNTPQSLAPFVAPFLCTDVATVAVQPESRGYGPADMVVIDTKYPIEETWYRDFGTALRSKVIRIDHPHATPESCALLIGPCAHWSLETVGTLADTFGSRFLYGWEYVMLRPEVTAHQPIPYAERIGGPIVFCAGGSDPTGALAQMYEWTADEWDRWLPAVKKIFAIPSMGQHTFPPRHHPLHTFFEPFTPALLQTASMVVSLFGVAAYECLYYQTPALMFAHTEENAMGARALQYTSAQACVTGGLLEKMDQEHFCDMVELVYHATIRKVTEGQQWIDGLGTQRVADAILAI